MRDVRRVDDDACEQRLSSYDIYPPGARAGGWVPPIEQVIHENLGIAHGCITTIHNVTGTQPIIDMAMTKKKVGFRFSGGVFFHPATTLPMERRRHLLVATERE